MKKSSMEVSYKKHRSHIKVGYDSEYEEEEDRGLIVPYHTDTMHSCIV